ncbi:MAG: winged helix-turn-helix transcriptional regulator [Candidatus Electrothrix sp. AR5]|nr:winged helix-turn-helix transcriptional regulator [Candidatus Electrothrix sp. AR5]
MFNTLTINMLLTQQELTDLIAAGENEQTEFKRSFDREAVETLSAFANTSGGNLLIGVDDNGTVKGVDIAQENLQNWNNTIKQACSPSILPESTIISYEGKKVVLLFIPEYPVKPVSCKGRYFKRVNNANHRMGITEIADLHLKTFNTSWDHYPDPHHTLAEISLDKVNAFITLANINRSFPLDDPPLTVLRKYELLQGHDQITNACYLLFADAETMFTAIDLGRFSNETSIKDSLTVRSDLFSSVNKALEFLRKHINKGYVISGAAQRTERWEYPLDALREIVINMIVHRDYTHASESVIKIFDDHIEFYNPGILLSGLSVPQLLSGSYTSTIRNKQIAALFKEAGLIERYGSGIKRILKSFADYDLPLPLFEEVQEGFRVTVTCTTQKTTQKNSTKEQLLKLLQKNPRITRSELAVQLSKSESTVKEHLAQLKAQARLKRIGSDRSGCWQVIAYEK